MPRINQLTGAVFVALCLATPLYAHPHVFIDSKLTLECAQGIPVALIVTWRFDAIFSQTVFQDVGRGRNGEFTPDVQKTIKLGYFDNLGRYEYFTQISCNNSPIKIKLISDFQVLQENKRLIYRFRIPLTLATISDKTNVLAISFFDDSFFISYQMMNDGDIEITGQAPAGIQTKLMDRKTPTQGWGIQVKQECRFSYRG